MKSESNQAVDIDKRLREAVQLVLPGDIGRLAQRDQSLAIGHGYSTNIADYQRGGREYNRGRGQYNHAYA